MGTTNFGSQTISFDFKEAGKAENFNKLNYKLFPVGLYSGGLLTRIDSTTVQISQFTCFTEDTNNGLGVRIETATTINLTVAPSTPYLIIRFGWSNVENNYADVIATDYASIDPKDIIIGRCAYDSGNNLQSTFDYTRRTVSSLQELDDKKDNLKVIAEESPSNTVYVLGGNLIVDGTPITLTSQSSPVINDTVDGRIDLVYINEAGTVSILEGEDNAVPTIPEFPVSSIVLAQITRGALETVVRGDQITNFNRVDRESTDISRLQSYIDNTKFLPIGAIIMFDAENSSGATGNSGTWTDNVTMPGWYACISSNSDKSCPNLVDTFVMGKVVSGAGVTGGNNSHIITSAELPLHDHGIAAHGHTTGTMSSDTHRHFIAVDSTSTTTTEVTSTSSIINYSTEDYNYKLKSAGSTVPNVGFTNNDTHNHTISINDAPATNTDDGGFANDSIDIRPAYYSAIYIRKCE